MPPFTLFLLAGPTAVGKSAVAMLLAERLGGGEIISVDSMQVYRGMDIGTAKPTAAERKRVLHHLIDVLHECKHKTPSTFKRSIKKTPTPTFAALESLPPPANPSPPSALH